jgi:hypothetical protein
MDCQSSAGLLTFSTMDTSAIIPSATGSLLLISHPCDKAVNAADQVASFETSRGFFAVEIHAINFPNTPIGGSFA